MFKDPGEGILIITIQTASFSAKSRLGILKPIICIQTPSNRLQTRSASGKRPVWNQDIRIHRKNQLTFQFQLIDSGIFNKRELGTGTIYLREVLEIGLLSTSFSLCKQNEKIGDVQMTLSFDPLNPVPLKIPSTIRNSSEVSQRKSQEIEQPKRKSVYPQLTEEVLLQPLPNTRLPLEQPQRPVYIPNHFTPNISSPQQPVIQSEISLQPIITHNVPNFQEPVKTDTFSPNRRSPSQRELELNIIRKGLSLQDINFGQQIYRSANGVQCIYNGWIQPKNTPVAIKVTYCQSLEDFNSIQKQTMTMCQVSHPNICRVYGNLLDNRFGTYNNILIMQKCQGGDLMTEILRRANNKQYWSEQELLRYLSDLIGAFQHLQSLGIVHSDIKPQNIVITPSMHIKVIDFGLSLVSPFEKFSTTKTYNVGGTMQYFSPLQFSSFIEIMSGLNPNGIVRHNPFKSDVYSLGLTYYHMCSLVQPAGLNDAHNCLEENIAKAIESVGYTEKSKGLLREMLRVDERERPDFHDLKEMINKIVQDFI